MKFINFDNIVSKDDENNYINKNVLYLNMFQIQLSLVRQAVQRQTYYSIY